MGGFFLIDRRRCEDTDSTRRLLSESFNGQGFSRPLVLHTPDTELHLYPNLVSPLVSAVEYPQGDFCACTGTLIYRGTLGKPALEGIYQNAGDVVSGSWRREALGQYCVVIRKAGVTALLVDPLGIYKVYRNECGGFWTSSMLAAASATRHPRIEKQCVFEYVFQGATYGNRTVIEQIDQVDPGDPSVVEGSLREETVTDPLADVRAGEGWDADPEIQIEVLRGIYRSIASAFGQRIDTALSGGYDSRLTLALLLEQGVRPRIHVYGADHDPDVVVARAIDAEMNLGLVHVDKSAWSSGSAGDYREVVRQNLLGMDGLPTDGVFRSGADLSTRKSRCQNGFLALNGGGGEIYRNFFYLPDRPLRARQLLWAFYSRFDPAVCTPVFSVDKYYENLQPKLMQAVGASGEYLTRRQVDLAYPLFRCRFWMGRNNSLNNRFGQALTPFVEPAAVAAAIKIPMKFKNFGRLESRMIELVNSQLAAYPSSYGHDFSGEPPLRRRLMERSVYLRPPILRRYTYRIKNRLTKTETGRAMSDAIHECLGQSFPYTERYFLVDRVVDVEQLNRIATLEMFLQHCNAVG